MQREKKVELLFFVLLLLSRVVHEYQSTSSHHQPYTRSAAPPRPPPPRQKKKGRGHGCTTKWGRRHGARARPPPPSRGGEIGVDIKVHRRVRRKSLDPGQGSGGRADDGRGLVPDHPRRRPKSAVLRRTGVIQQPRGSHQQPPEVISRVSLALHPRPSSPLQRSHRTQAEHEGGMFASPANFVEGAKRTWGTHQDGRNSFPIFSQPMKRAVLAVAT